MTILTGRALLEIPHLFIDHKTGPILRNLVAYEQCDKTVKPYFTSYIMFFDGLVNTPEDVQIVRRRSFIMFWAATMKFLSYSMISLRMLLMISMSATFLH